MHLQSRLRDSNPLYSLLWRPFIQPFGNSESDTLPNPLGEGRVSLRSYLTMFNFKANHRKLILADKDNQLTALVTSANPHDGSSGLRTNGTIAMTGNSVWITTRMPMSAYDYEYCIG